MWIKQLLTHLVIVKTNQINQEYLAYKIKQIKENLIYCKLGKGLRIIRLKYSYDQKLWLKKKQKNQIRQFYTLLAHMRIRRAKKDALPIFEAFIIHECHINTLIAKIQSFYRLMIRIQKKARDKPMIRAARIYMLNTSWDKVINQLHTTTQKYWKKPKKGIQKKD